MSVGRDYFGSYRLIRLIRVGHTCQIWEAIDERDERRCALKALQKENVGSKEDVGFLKHEYEVGKALQHPNVIETYDLVTRHDLPFVVLEFFNSQNMKQRLRTETENLTEFTQLVIENAAQGLAYLHSQGWIHRDIKPDNFLVGESGEVKLIDFAIAVQPPKGLAKLFSLKSKIQGTRSYMSPEQIRGTALDERTDIYSFGCVLYELVTGKLPFTGTSPNELLNKHLSAPVPLASAANRAVTPEFAELVSKMMSKQPEKRPASVKDFLRHFQTMRPFKSQRTV